MATEDIYNFRKISDRVITGGQPSEEQLRAAAAEGFEAVVNLAPYYPDHALPDEAGLVRGLDMEYHHIPVLWDQPLESDFYAFEDRLQQLGDRKILIHCAANYRVTAFYSLYALKHLGWSRGQAAALRSTVWQDSSYPVWEALIQKMEDEIESRKK